jgi:hypothetical protein
VTLKNNGIKRLYHFTDASNIPSIEEHGLMSASNLVESAIVSKMNSDEVSRSLDASRNLENFVRLSFCSANPMMYVVYNAGRISEPVRLEIKLEAVSRPGVKFSDCNANRVDARVSTNPNIVRFDVVKAPTVFDVAADLRQFYQAEVLVPSPLPRHLIVIPSKPVKMPKKKPAAVDGVAVGMNGSDLTAKVPKKNHAHEVAVVKSASVKNGDLTLSQLTPVKVPKKNLASIPELARERQSAGGKRGGLTAIASEAVEIPKKPAHAAPNAAGRAVEGGDLSVSEPTSAERAIECEARRRRRRNHHHQLLCHLLLLLLHQLPLGIFR